VQELLDRHGSWMQILAAEELRSAAATISAPSIYALAFHVLGLGEGHRLLDALPEGASLLAPGCRESEPGSVTSRRSAAQ
jgi:hypothetical protein